MRYRNSSRARRAARRIERDNDFTGKRKDISRVSPAKKPSTHLGNRPIVDQRNGNVIACRPIPSSEGVFQKANGRPLPRVMIDDHECHAP